MTVSVCLSDYKQTNGRMVRESDTTLNNRLSHVFRCVRKITKSDY